MCYSCLAGGVEHPSHPAHRRSSGYRVQDNYSAVSLYEKGWSVADELALLDAIEIYGLGNWRDCATYVGGGRTDMQVSRHYTRVYLEGPAAPLPSAAAVPVPLGKDVSSSSASSSSSSSSSSASASGSGADEGMAGGEEGAPTAAVSGEGSASSSSSSSSSSAASAAAAAAGRGSGGHLSATPGYSAAHVPRTDIAGYLPLRGDFDVEWENDAEAVLGDLDFVEGEHATETELKLKILEIYNAKLDERERRKTFVIERGLLDYKRLLAVERRRPKEEREIYDAFRPFARFLSPKEHEDLVRGVILEHR